MVDRVRSNSSVRPNVLSNIRRITLGFLRLSRIEYTRNAHAGFSRMSPMDSTNFSMRITNFDDPSLSTLLNQIHEDAVRETSELNALISDERSSQISMHFGDFHEISGLNAYRNILENSFNNNLSVHNRLLTGNNLISSDALRLTTNTPEPSPFAELNYFDLVMGSADEIDALNKNDICPISLLFSYEIEEPVFIQGRKEIYEFSELLKAMKVNASNPITRAPVEVNQLRKISFNDIPAPTESA